MVPVPAVVRRVRRQTRDTCTVDLDSPRGQGFSFRPGQFNMVYVFGIGEVPISISGNPQRPVPISHTVRAVGAITTAIRGLRRGDVVGLRGPFGSSWPVEAAEGMDVLIVAGGVGLAPLRPAMLHVLANRERYGRVALLYGARTPHDLLFRRDLERWRGRFDLHVAVTVDAPVLGWNGGVGVVTALIQSAPVDFAECVAWVCGPEVMMRFAVAELLRLRVAAERITLSMERNMKCAVGLCGHCQYGPYLLCREGPVFRYPDVQRWLTIKEV